MEPINLSPVAEVARQMGAVMVEESGWLLPNHYAKVLVEQPYLALLDESAQGKIMIHGPAGARATAALGLEAPVEIGRGYVAGDVAVYRLRADQLFVSVPPSREVTTCAALMAAATRERVTITDVTHGRAQLRLVGPASAELLSRLCGLDLAPGRVADHSAHQTSVAKTTQLVIRSDLPDGVLSYVLIGARSLGEYLWRSLLAAGSDQGLHPVGRADLRPPAP